jgi:proline dehydrogenase
VLRKGLLRLSRSAQVEALLTRLPAAGGIAARYVPGGEVADVVAAVRSLVANGLEASIGLLGDAAADEDAAELTVRSCTDLLEALHADGLARHVEISVRLSALGQSLPDVGAKLSLENVQRVTGAARFAGAAVTLDTEGHCATEATLDALRELRKDYPETGIVLQACLRRTEDDCRALAFEGSRVRLVKGAYDEPGTHAFTDRHDVDKSFVRCLKVLMAGQGYPVVATHDPRLIRIAGALATRFDRVQGSYEYQMLLGVRGEEQKRLADIGEQVRVHVPFGQGWYDYLVRNLAEGPASPTSFLRSLLSQK